MCWWGREQIPQAWASEPYPDRIVKVEMLPLRIL
jgi:hypothetical protein